MRRAATLISKEKEQKKKKKKKNLQNQLLLGVELLKINVFMVQGNERHCEAQLVCRNEKEDGLCCKWAFIECHGIFSLYE